MKSIRVPLRPTFWKGKAHNVKSYVGLKSKFLCMSGLWWWHGASLTRPPELTLTSCLSSWGGEHPVDKQAQCTQSAINKTSNLRRESVSKSPGISPGWGASCFHSCSLNINQSPLCSTPTLENHLTHFSANSVPAQCPEGARLFPQCEVGQLEIRKEPGVLTSRCFLSTSNSQQGSRESW